MDIEVGDYARTKSGIGRVEQIGNSLFWLEDGSIIEVGDFVNGYRVVDKYLYAGEKPVLETERIENNVYCLCEGDIREILTREKYTQNCYKVEREIV